MQLLDQCVDRYHNGKSEPTTDIAWKTNTKLGVGVDLDSMPPKLVFFVDGNEIKMPPRTGDTFNPGGAGSVAVNHTPAISLAHRAAGTGQQKFEPEYPPDEDAGGDDDEEDVEPDHPLGRQGGAPRRCPPAHTLTGLTVSV